MMNESVAKATSLKTPSAYTLGLLLAIIFYAIGFFALFKGLSMYQEMSGGGYGRRGMMDPSMLLLMFSPGLLGVALGGILHLLSVIAKNTAHLVQLQNNGRGNG